MNAQIKALRTLRKIRERRGEALDRALAQARERVAAGEQDLASATGRQGAAAADEAAGRQRRDALTRVAFTPEALIALTLRIDDLAAASVQAVRAAGERREALDRQCQALQDAQGALRRHQQRLQSIGQQLERLEGLEAAAQDEQADDDVQETAIARHVAKARAARAADAHG